LRSCSRSHSPLCCGRPEPLACCGATSAGPEKVGSRSHPLRHLLSRKRSPDPAAAGSPVATTGNSVQSGKHQARSLNPPVPLIAIDSALDRGGSRRSRGWPQGSVQPRLTCRGADGKGRCSARFLQCNRSDRWPASIAGHPARAPWRPAYRVSRRGKSSVIVDGRRSHDRNVLTVHYPADSLVNRVFRPSDCVWSRPMSRVQG
jgi:hypothetical protein